MKIEFFQLTKIKMKQTFHFLCGNFERRNFIYAIKFAENPWHYFDEKDSLSSVHSTLPGALNSLIATLDKVRTINVSLNEEQARNYYVDDKFIFKNKELKTYLQLTNKQFEVKVEQSEPSKSLIKNHQLVFISGQTNLLLFLNAFEECRDLKTDKDKMLRIRNFVDEADRVEFSELYFTSDWSSVRRAFLKKYSLQFVTNKRRELNIDFNEETSLRSFVERKLKSLSLYTTLPFFNQMEVVLNDLPDEIANLFLLNEKMTSSKAEILEFCESIQDLVQTVQVKTENEAQTMQVKIENELESVQNDQDSSNGNRMEIFTFDPDLKSESLSHYKRRGTINTGGADRGAKRGRPPKNMKSRDNQTDDSQPVVFLKHDVRIDVRR